MRIILFTILSLMLLSGCRKHKSGNTDSKPLGKEAVFIDPYTEGHDSTKFNPGQVDFSKEYLSLQTQRVGARSVEVTPLMGGYIFDTDSIFCTADFEQNGVLGTNYRRIRMHISKAKQQSFDSLVFDIEGKSNVKGNICNFKGELKIQSIYEYFDEPDYPGQAVLFARYKFNEDAAQAHPGTFEGVFEAAVKIDRSNKVVRFDNSFSLSDDYYNRTYVGTWTDYGKQIVQKCIWGDYRLPFTFGFDCGDGEIIVCDKYVNNGWKSYNDGSDYESVAGEGHRLRNKWWKK